MLIPKLFYGKTTKVKKECRKLSTKIRKGNSFEEVFGSLSLVDTKQNNGLIVLKGPNPLVGDRPHFHVYIWLWMLSDSYYRRDITLKEELLSNGFKFCTDHPWAFAALFDTVNCEWFRGNLVRMWPSIVRFYPIYENEGKRFSKGSNVPSEFWNIPTTIAGVMLKMGVPEKEFLPPPGKELIPYTYPPFWHLVEKYKLPTDFPPYVPLEI